MALDPISRRLIALALEEDLGPGDVTSALVPDGDGRAKLLAKQPLVLAGTEAFEAVFAELGRSRIGWEAADGDAVGPGEVLGRIEGPSRELLMGERTALNLLQRLSGVATMARAAANAVAGTRAKVVDTRKTTPGLRALEKAAIRAGGCTNHRFGLFDGVLIKDNHITAVGGIKPAVERARAEVHHLLKIEVEVSSLAEAEEALAAGADVIMLDNMPLDAMAEAVERIDGRALVEASGNVTLERLGAIAGTGVDLISMGALTHSAPAADISLKWESGS